MYNLECAGRLVEVDGYQFLAGYSHFNWIHSSGYPHVWAEQTNCKTIASPTVESRLLAMRQLDEVSASRGLTHSARDVIRNHIARDQTNVALS